MPSVPQITNPFHGKGYQSSLSNNQNRPGGEQFEIIQLTKTQAAHNATDKQSGGSTGSQLLPNRTDLPQLMVKISKDPTMAVETLKQLISSELLATAKSNGYTELYGELETLSKSIYLAVDDLVGEMLNQEKQTTMFSGDAIFELLRGLAKQGIDANNQDMLISITNFLKAVNFSFNHDEILNALSANLRFLSTYFSPSPPLSEKLGGLADAWSSMQARENFELLKGETVKLLHNVSESLLNNDKTQILIPLIIHNLSRYNTNEYMVKEAFANMMTFVPHAQKGMFISAFDDFLNSVIYGKFKDYSNPLDSQSSQSPQSSQTSQSSAQQAQSPNQPQQSQQAQSSQQAQPNQQSQSPQQLQQPQQQSQQAQPFQQGEQVPPQYSQQQQSLQQGQQPQFFQQEQQQAQSPQQFTQTGQGQQILQDQQGQQPQSLQQQPQSPQQFAQTGQGQQISQDQHGQEYGQNSVNQNNNTTNSPINQPPNSENAKFPPLYMEKSFNGSTFPPAGMTEDTLADGLRGFLLGRLNGMAAVEITLANLINSGDTMADREMMQALQSDLAKMESITALVDYLNLLLRNLPDVKERQVLFEMLSETISGMAEKGELPANSPNPVSETVVAQSHQEQQAQQAESKSSLEELTNFIEKNISHSALKTLDSYNASNLLQSLINAPGVYTPLAHFIIPLQIGDVKAFGELWVDNDDKSGVAGKTEGVKTHHLFLTFEIESVGRFETDMYAHGKEISLAVMHPESFRDEIAALQEKIARIIASTDYSVKQFRTGVLREPHDLTQIFPKIEEKRQGLDITV